MNDLISRSALLQDIENCVVFSGRPGTASAELRGANKVTDRIKSASAVDAVEVKDLRKQLLREGTLLYGGNVEFERKMGGYNPSSFVAGFNYALQRMSGWVTFLNGERKTNEND